MQRRRDFSQEAFPVIGRIQFLCQEGQQFGSIGGFPDGPIDKNLCERTDKCGNLFQPGLSPLSVAKFTALPLPSKNPAKIFRCRLRECLRRVFTADTRLLWCGYAEQVLLAANEQAVRHGHRRCDDRLPHFVLGENLECALDLRDENRAVFAGGVNFSIRRGW